MYFLDGATSSANITAATKATNSLGINSLTKTDKPEPKPLLNIVKELIKYSIYDCYDGFGDKLELDVDDLPILRGINMPVVIYTPVKRRLPKPNYANKPAGCYLKEGSKRGLIFAGVVGAACLLFLKK